MNSGKDKKEKGGTDITTAIIIGVVVVIGWGIMGMLKYDVSFIDAILNNVAALAILIVGGFAVYGFWIWYQDRHH